MSQENSIVCKFVLKKVRIYTIDISLGMSSLQVQAMLYIMRFLIFIILVLSSPAYSENSYSRILAGITPKSITIIGETHKRPEAIQFFQSLITEYTQQNKCLTVALDIASSQQSLLDEIKQGRTTVTDIEIAPVINHPPFGH